MSSSLLLLSNWLEEVEDELRYCHGQMSPLSPQQVNAAINLNRPEWSSEGDGLPTLTEEQLQEYDEAEQVCPFNLVITTTLGGKEEEALEEGQAQGAKKKNNKIMREEGCSGGGGSSSNTTSDHQKEYRGYDLSATFQGAQSTASKQTSNATNNTQSASRVEVAECASAAVSVRTPQKLRGSYAQARLNVFSSQLLVEHQGAGDVEVGSEGGDQEGKSRGEQEEEEGDEGPEGASQSYGGLSPEYRSRKSSNAYAISMAPFAQLNPANLDFASRKAYYTPSGSTSIHPDGPLAASVASPGSGGFSPAMTASSSPRRRCWVDLPDETSALFEGSGSASGRLQRSNTSRVKYGPTTTTPSTGVKTPAPELALGEMPPSSSVAPTTSSGAAGHKHHGATNRGGRGGEIVGVQEVESSSLSSSDDEEEDIVQVVSWLDNEEPSEKEGAVGVASDLHGRRRPSNNNDVSAAPPLASSMAVASSSRAAVPTSTILSFPKVCSSYSGSSAGSSSGAL